MSRALLDAFLGAGHDHRDARDTGGTLTPREREILQLLAEGASSKEMGEVLGIGVRTVEAHRAAIMRKLGIGSLAELVRYAVRNHLVEP